MQINIPTLFVEVNLSSYIFVVGTYDANQNFKIIDKIIVLNKDIKENKFTNISQAQEVIKKNIEIMEKNFNCIFKEAVVIIDIFDLLCLNISSFKKLNGSQVLKENIFYILNSLKLTVTESEKEKTILHIFNSKSVLDGVTNDNLPIGLFGDFYNHELSFFLISNNDFKNIKQIFNKNNINIKKIFIKKFIEGTQLINQNNYTETFFKIEIGKNNSYIYFFEKSSLKYVESFQFGTNIIVKDIVKVCSIHHETVENILSDGFIEHNNFDNNELLEEKYFINENYRKIRKKLIKDIADARIDEITNIILNKNVNLRSFKKNYGTIFLIIKDKRILDNFKENFKFNFSQNINFKPTFINDLEVNSIIMNTAKILVQGWKKEAIPMTQTKNSLITRIFKSLFG
tara:strand:- start:1192 stop:2391 length:1200 start_codon:yes stop_codon:yes gene_type:complete